jgi:hypothetical protein
MGPEILKITMVGDRPDDMVIIVNAVKDAYLKEIINKESTQRSSRYDHLKSLLGLYEDKTKTKKRTLREMAEALGAKDEKNLALRQQIALKEQAHSQAELTRVRAEVRKLRVDLGIRMSKMRVGWEDHAAVLSTFPSPGLPINVALVGVLYNDPTLLPSSEKTSILDPKDPRVDEYLMKDASANKQFKRLQKLEEDIAETKRLYKPEEYRKRTRLRRAELRGLQKTIGEMRQKAVKVVAEKLQTEARHKALTQLNKMQAELTTLTNLEQVVNADVTRLDKYGRKQN